MRILHVVPSYLPATRYGGPIVSVHALCRALASKGHDVHVFTTNVDGPNDSPVPLGRGVPIDGVNVWYFPVPSWRRLYRAPTMDTALREHVASFRVIHTHSVFLWPTWAAARAARMRGVPYVMSPRGMLVKDLVMRRSALPKLAWISLIERRNIEAAAAIHVTSEIESKALSEFRMALPPVHEVPNGIDPTELDTPGPSMPPAVEAVFAGGQPVVLSLGRIDWKKGIDRLVKAMRNVPDAVLLVVGNDEEGCLPGLVALAESEGIRDRVVFADAVYSAAKYEIYGRAAAFVLPSHSENFGNVVLEALGCGCPVVVTESVGAASVVREVEGGVVAAGDPASLAAAIIQVLAMPTSARAPIGERVRVGYSWASIADRMLEVYGLTYARGQP